MLRIQRSVTHEQEFTNCVYISPNYTLIPQDTKYVVLNRRWVFALDRSEGCPVDAILINCSIRNLIRSSMDSVRLDRQVTVEPLTGIFPTTSQPANTTYLAIYRMENPEVGPPTMFRKLAIEVLNSLGTFNITNMNESSIEFSVSEWWIDTLMYKFHNNYNNIMYYIDRLVKVSNTDAKQIDYLNYLNEERQVPSLDMMRIEIPLENKVAGTFADMDYGECVCHVIQPNITKLYDYIKYKFSNSVIYDKMPLAVDAKECFGLDTNVAMMFHVKFVNALNITIDTFDGYNIQSKSPFGILTHATVIEFVN